MWRRSLACIAIALLLRSPLSASAADDKGVTEACIRMLQRTVTPQRDGTHLARLAAMRQLHDPSLKALFQRLVDQGTWEMQSHGVLGLAELDPAQKIDLPILAKIDPRAQDAIATAGLDLNLIPRDQIRKLLAQDSLHPMPRMFLNAELVSLKEQINPEELNRFINDDDVYVAGLASCLLAQVGKIAPWQAFQTRLAEMPSEQHSEIAVWLFEAIRRYHLTVGVPWVQSYLNQSELPPNLAYRGVYTLLELDPDAGLDAWSTFLGDKPSYQQRVRFGLLLLSAGKNVPPSIYDRLAPAKDEEILIRMIAVGKALANGSDPAQPIIQLLELHHAKTADWAMTYLPKLPPEQANRVYAHLIDRVPKATPDQGDSGPLAAQAAFKLFESDPKAVLDRLAAAEDDSTQQHAILLGLCDAYSPLIGEAAASLRRIGSGAADSLALFLIAKYAPTLKPEDKQQLGKIAAGGGRVSEIFQVQAAWLYLKHTGQMDSALAAAFEANKTERSNKK